MELIDETKNKTFEIEKIITCKLYKNKKYYLIKWLCYPISESTWEPKSSLNHLNSLLDKFESEYPFSIDKEMYNIYLEEMNKRKKRGRKAKKAKEIKNGAKLLSKKRKFECFSEFELKNEYYDKLKNHLHINMIKRINNKQDTDIIIDLSLSTTSNSEDSTLTSPNEKETSIVTEENVQNENKLIVPIME